MASTANAIDFHRIEASKRQQSKIAPTISDYGGVPDIQVVSSPQLALFDTLAKTFLENDFAEKKTFTVQPVTPITESTSSISFVVDPSLDWCIDPSTIYMATRMGIRRVEKGTLIPTKKSSMATYLNSLKNVKSEDKDKDTATATATSASENVNDYDFVSFSQEPLATHISHVHTYINGQLVDNCSLYDYQSVILVGLNYTEAARNTQLKSSGYMTNTMDNSDHLFAKNYSLQARAEKTQNGKLWTLRTKLLTPITASPLVIPPKNKMEIQIFFNSDLRALIRDDASMHTYKTYYDYFSLSFQKKRLARHALTKLSKMIMEIPASIAVPRLHTTHHFINGNVTNALISNPFSAPHVPFRLWFMLVKTDAYSGKYDANAYNFEWNNIIGAVALVDGVEFAKLKMDDEDKAEAYDALLMSQRIHGSDQPATITHSEFAGSKSSYAIMAFDFTINESSTCIPKQGILSLELTFSPKAPAVGLCCILLGEFGQRVNIDNYLGVNVQNTY